MSKQNEWKIRDVELTFRAIIRVPAEHRCPPDGAFSQDALFHHAVRELIDKIQGGVFVEPRRSDIGCTYLANVDWREEQE